LFHNLNCRDIEEIFYKYKVDLRTPTSIDEFLRHVQDFEKIKEKGAHLLFSEIEHEVKERSKFLKSQ
jgi:hypothetical protein